MWGKGMAGKGIRRGATLKNVAGGFKSWLSNRRPSDRLSEARQRLAASENHSSEGYSIDRRAGGLTRIVLSQTGISPRTFGGPTDGSLQAMRTSEPQSRWYYVFEDVYEAFSRPLRRGARKLIGSRLRSRVSEDDIVQSVFRTFHRRNNNGECQFDHTCALRNYLWTVMTNKVHKHAQFHRAKKRDLERQVTIDASGNRVPLADRRPSSEELAALRDEIESLTRGFLPRDMEILKLHFEGHTSPEIAARVQCSRWTVRRVLVGFGDRLRQRLQESGGL
jgi:RNA polymerase sigma-70 factor, ECF subfamily